ASTAADTGREAHVQARAVFTTLRSDVLEVVRVLDGLNAARSPGQRAKWESARNVFGPVTRGGEVTDPTLLGSEDGSRKTAWAPRGGGPPPAVGLNPVRPAGLPGRPGLWWGGARTSGDAACFA